MNKNQKYVVVAYDYVEGRRWDTGKISTLTGCYNIIRNLEKSSVVTGRFHFELKKVEDFNDDYIELFNMIHHKK